MKYLLAVLILTLSFVARAEQWEAIVQSKDGSVKFYLDKSSVVTSGFAVEFAIKSNHPTAPHVAHWRTDCKERKADILFLTYLDQAGKTLNIVRGPMKVETAPGEVADLIITYVCRDYI